ncbi:MAG: hypothetical protein ACLR4Z_17010 [Butyricicoccaceae bacterium]
MTFKVAAYDEAGLIGEARCQRAIVAKERKRAAHWWHGSQK